MLLCVCYIKQPVQAKVINSVEELPVTVTELKNVKLQAPAINGCCGNRVKDILFPNVAGWYFLLDNNTANQKLLYGKTIYVKAIYVQPETFASKAVKVPIKVNHNFNYNKYKKATSKKAGHYAYYYCKGCGRYFNRYKRQVSAESLIIPAIPSTKAVVMGKTMDVSQLITDGRKAFSKVSVDKKYKNYLTVSGRKLKLCSEFKKGLPSTIPVTIEMKDAERPSGKRYYTVKVKVTPDIMITKTSISGGTKYRYDFRYNFIGATKVRVRVKEYDVPSMNRVLDTYVSGTVSNRRSYMLISTNGVNAVGGKLTFVVTVCYDGGNITRTITK